MKIIVHPEQDSLGGAFIVELAQLQNRYGVQISAIEIEDESELKFFLQQDSFVREAIEGVYQGIIVKRIN